MKPLKAAQHLHPIDMVFVLRMAQEISRTKDHPLYVVFVDLVTAYDSVVRAGLWKVLLIKGIPSNVVLQCLYEDEMVRVSAEGELTNEFQLQTGLGQGCCVAPLLFNIFFAALLEQWRAVEGRRLKWGTRVDGILRRQSLHKYGSFEPCDLAELGYADDLALLADCYDMLRRLTQEFQLHVSSWGLILSVEKTKALCTTKPQQPPVPVVEYDGFDHVQFEQSFEYLGCDIKFDGDCSVNIFSNINSAHKAFWGLAQTVWYGRSYPCLRRCMCLGPV